MARVVLVFGATFQPSAACEDCGWHYPMSANSRAAAKDHAKHNGHRVSVEVLKRDIYEREERAS